MKFKCSNLIKPLVYLAVCVPAVSQAADITFNGYASLRATKADADGIGAGINGLTEIDGTSFKQGSLFALQARAKVNDNISATVQFLAEGVNDFDVEAEWAYLTYDFKNNHQISVGRFVNPIFHQSQYRNVGYTNNYATLPGVVYREFDFDTIEGISFDSKYQIADYFLDTKLLYGSWDGDLVDSGLTLPWALKGLLSVSAVFGNDWWNIFAGGFKAEVESESIDNILFGIYESAGLSSALEAGLTTVSEVDDFRQRTAWSGKDAIYWYAGTNIDYKNFLLEYEYSKYTIEESANQEIEVFYLALGYKLNDFTFTVHQQDLKQSPTRDFLSGVTNPILQGLGEGVQNSFLFGADAYGVDIRYDVAFNTALKFGYLKGNSESSFVGDFNILTAGVDVIF